MGVSVQVANDIRINIDVKGEDQAARDLKKVGDAAEKTGGSISDLGAEATAAGKATEKAGDKFKETADDAGHLRREIDATTDRVKALIGELDKTGDKSLLKDIRKERRNLNQFVNLAKLMEPVAEAGVTAGSALVEKLAEGFRTGSAALKGALAPVLVGSIVALSPLIGAAISSVIVAGIGSAGIGAGIALAMKDPAVQAAAEGLKASLLDSFQGASQGFVAPLLDSLRILGQAGRSFATGLKLDTLAPLLTVLAKGLAGLGQNILPGVNKALEASKPLLRVLGNELPKIGTALSDFFTTLSEESDGAAMFLAGSLQFVQRFITGAGEVLSTLSGIFEWSVRTSAAVSGALEDVLSWIPGIGMLLGEHAETANDKLEGMISALDKGKDASGDFAGGLKDIDSAAYDAKRSIESLQGVVDTYLNKIFGLEEAQDAVANTFALLTDQIKEQREEGEKGAGSLEGQSQAARDNREVMRRLTEQYGTLVVEQIRAGKSADQLRQEFVDAAVQAGINTKKAKEYADKLFQIPEVKHAILELKLKLIGGINSGGQGGAIFSQRASGGPVTAGRGYLVGENGPELVTFGANGMVHNAAATRSMMSGASGGSSMAFAGGTPQIHVTVMSGDPITRAVAESLRFDIRTTANGDPIEYFT